ncbi:EamA family transporter [Flavobacteriaceae bacterium R38]|nr:EamA family transporter [Flavobacteriaceae bacterium R38]
MIYLILSIAISSFLYVIFKFFAHFKVNTLQAITINYIVAGSMGLLSYDHEVNVVEISHKPWILGAVMLGGVFICVFNLMALTSQKNGVSVASVASKMSIVIPVIFAVIMYGERLGFVKILGIGLALIAVYLASIKQTKVVVQKNNLIYPFLLFLGSGIIDASLKYMEVTYVKSEEIPLFSAFIFYCAAVIGIIIVTYKKINGGFHLHWKNIIAGTALGIPNYYSIYYLIKALQNDTFNSSTIFTINNVAIVMFSTLLGILIFKEKLIIKNWLGILIAILSIFLVASGS